MSKVSYFSILVIIFIEWQDKLFGDVMVKDEDGNLSVDFKLFDTLKDVRNLRNTTRRYYSSYDEKTNPDCPFQTEFDELLFQPRPMSLAGSASASASASGDGDIDVDVVLVGGAVPSIDESENTLVHICTFSIAILSCFRLLGVKHRFVVVNLDDKPEWFLERSAKGETPLVYVRALDTYLQNSEECHEYIDRYLSHVRSLCVHVF